MDPNDSIVNNFVRQREANQVFCCSYYILSRDVFFRRFSYAAWKEYAILQGQCFRNTIWLRDTAGKSKIPNWFLSDDIEYWQPSLTFAEVAFMLRYFRVEFTN